MQLSRGTTPLAGTVSLLQGSATAAVFTPAAPLEASTAYQLVVTQAIRDLDGDALAAGATVEFTTGTMTVGPVAWVSILGDTLGLEAPVGSQFQLTAIARDSQGLLVTGRPIAWTSGDPTVATVSATGLVTAMAEGGTRIEAEIDGQFAGVELLVSAQLTPVQSVTVTPKSARVALDGTLALVAEVRDTTGAIIGSRPITWTSANPTVATVAPVENGTAIVTGMGVGSARISATVEGKSDTAVVTVMLAGTVTVSAAVDSVAAGNAVTLTATVGDAAGNLVDHPLVIWTSSAPEVATVRADSAGSAGLAFATVTGVSPGSTTITATFDVASDTASVTVPLGSIDVTVATSGVDLPDGYGIALDSAVVNRVEINGGTTFADVWPGPHTVDLNGVAPNCAVSGPTSLSVMVASGRTTHVAFVVGCAAFGAVQVTAATSGADLDADGYTVQVEGQPAQALSPNGGVAVFSQVAAGLRLVTLGGVRTNCTVSGSSSVTVTVPSGAAASVAFAITCAQFMPTGSAIAFVRYSSGDPDVFLVTGGSVPLNLTNSVGVDGPPVWSPDGSRIAFVSYRDGNAEIYVVNGDGLGQVNLTTNGATESSPAWSPDGSRIAFVSNRDGNAEIYVMSADGSGQVNLTNNGATESAPVWSLDGSRIAFVSNRDGNAEIYVMNADGSGQVNLTNNGATESSPAWSPDGWRIAFVSDRDGSSEIYLMSPDGTGQVNLTNSPTADDSPAWSPDGRRIAFTSNGIAVINADGTGFARLVTNSSPPCVAGPPVLSRTSSSPVWSPDGTVIAFRWAWTLRVIPKFGPGTCVTMSTRSGISVISPDGSRPVALVDDPVSGSGSPAWRPR